MKYKKLILVLMLCVPSTLTNAQEENWLKDFYNSAGVGINTTQPSVSKLQSMSVYSGGGISYRVPSRSTQLMTATAPGYKLGCGGIDVWGGSFGYINKDALVEALRNFGNEVPAYFFKIALKTMAPEIESVLSDIQKVADLVNRQQINSCETLENYFGNPPDMTGKSLEERVSAFGSAMNGDYGNHFEAKLAYQDDPAKAKQVAIELCVKHKSQCEKIIGGNLTYNALKRVNGLSEDQIEIFMAMVGTIVVEPIDYNDLNKNFDAKYKASLIKWKDLLEADGTPNNVKKYESCSSVPNDFNLPCVSGFGDKTTGIQLTGFIKITKIAMEEILNAIDSRLPLNLDSESGRWAEILMRTSQIPIYQMIANAYDSGPGGKSLATQIIDSMSEIVATQFAYSLYMSVSADVNLGLAMYEPRLETQAKESVANLRREMDKQQKEIREDYEARSQEYSRRLQSIQLLLEFRQNLYKGMGPDLTASLFFGAR